MNHYKIQQKILPSAYPSINLYSNISKLDANNKVINTLYIKRTIAEWASFSRNAVSPMIVYLSGLMELIANHAIGKKDNNDDSITGTLYGLITRATIDDSEAYLLRFILCNSNEELEEIKKEIYAENENIWQFTYGEGLNKPVLDMLYIKRTYAALVVPNVSHVIMTIPQDEFDEYLCSIQEVIEKEREEKQITTTDSMEDK